jgi:hypothetical protein
MRDVLTGHPASPVRIVVSLTWTAHRGPRVLDCLDDEVWGDYTKKNVSASTA